MRYIVFIMLTLSLPAMALESSPSKNISDTTKTLQQKIQKKIGNSMCDPREELKVPTFN